jgi:hypothetical protein
MKYLFILFSAATLISCAGNADTDSAKDSTYLTTCTEPVTVGSNADASAPVTQIQWLDSVNQNLASVKKGQVVDIVYRFRNVGNNPLVVESVTAGCGCTVAEKPTEPIAPGGEGVIRGKFDSHNQGPGTMVKNINVISNTDPRSHNLTFNITVTE